MTDSKELTVALPPETRAMMLQKEDSLFLNVAKFEQMQRAAGVLSKANFVPAQFRNNMPNCLIALDLADRMKMHPLMLMQTMYIVHGRPGFEGKFMSALVNASKRYEDPLEYEWKGEQGKPEWGCRAWAVRKSTGKTVYGPWVDWAMVTAEGWNKPKGGRDGSKPVQSKWMTMPEVMFMYRAASFFAKTNDSDLIMGMQTIEELEDSEPIELVRSPAGTFTDGHGEKTADLYNTTKEAPKKEPEKEEKADVDGPSDDLEAADHGSEKPTEKTDLKEEPPDPAGEEGAETGEFHPAWQPAAWHNSKAPGMKNLAEQHQGVFHQQPLEVRIQFAEKWNSLKSLEALRFPFDGDGRWIGYQDPEPGEKKPAEDNGVAGTTGEDEEPGKLMADMPSDEIIQRMNAAWSMGSTEAKAYACEVVGCGSSRPEPKQFGTWLKYFDAKLAEINKRGKPDEDNTNQNDPPDFLDGGVDKF